MEPLNPTKFNELITKQFPDDVWLVDRLIPDNGLSVITGYPASYKTWLMLNLAICISTGKPFLDDFQTKKSKVLLIDEENGERILQGRIKKMTSQQDLDIDIISLKNFKLTDSDEIIKYCLENRIGVVMIDSLIRTHKGDENSSQEMAKLFDEFKKFKNSQLSVIFTHHNRKTGERRANPIEDMRGSSEIFAFVDSGLSVRKAKDKDEIIATQIKQRVDEEIEPFNIAIDRDDLSVRFKYIGIAQENRRMSKAELAKSGILDLLGEDVGTEFFQKQIISALKKQKIGESAVKEAIGLMIAENLIQARQGDGNTHYYSLANQVKV